MGVLIATKELFFTPMYWRTGVGVEASGAGRLPGKTDPMPRRFGGKMKAPM